MRVEAKHFAYPMCVARKIQSGTDANLKDSAFCTPYDPLAIRSELTISHGKVDQMRHNVVLVESHGSY